VEPHRSRYLYLVRHGRVATQVPAEPIDAQAFERWRDSVDGVGIDPFDAPPRSLIAIAARAGLIVSSDLARAVESAHAVAPGKEIRVIPLLREIRLPVPKMLPIRLPHAMWNALAHARWGVAILTRAPVSATDRQRASACADRLEDWSRVEPRILAMTHGVFRRPLARTLQERRWDVHARRGYAHWSVWELTRGRQ
jgi:broad specificity phosphatase PhoE